MTDPIFVSDAHIPPMSDPTHGAVAMARWVDDLVHEELSEPFALSEARLYVKSVGQSQTAFLLDSDENPYRLLERTNQHIPVKAAALVVTGWCAPTDPSDSIGRRPSEHPMRQRVRITVAIDAHGIATVMRRDGAPNDPEVMDDRGEGELPDALERWWCGELV
jgi:hypothetical protein